MKKTGIFLLLLSLLAACQESDKERLTRLVQEWDGKEIAFPAQAVFTVQGRDTVDFRWQSAPYRIVTYVDSLGCASCKLQLPKWKQLIVETDSLFGKKKLSYVFFFHPKDARELTYLTRRDAFTYPVCFDREDAFNHLNRFPSEMALQTFLLDKDNRVVAIGNPVHNPQVKELYLNIIGGKRSATTGTKQTSASLSEQDVRFGSFPMGEKKERKVTLKNTGDAPLVIHGVDTSCGCTRVEYSQRPLRPGEETTLLIIYEADEAGHFRKTVDVYCNTADAPLRISVTGEAVSN
ncbi:MULTISPECIES: DUF1573 domain-containing protein [unclassified Bacteroides]|uniref:DUF1573 domain-containing protein n=1 Tax=unclassified Bacteroides TaxID=2646097 RepID=UPI000B398CF0|nr:MULTISPECIES: DUF1573 domain-containing protein [unclassified Bacteroides]OUN80015.1 hypothetical protein B5G04_10730 [Bacteroides sp. An51A]OUP27265.1 hypothetical protein B5F25_19325 [Bacteroides sp. An19]